MLWIIAVLFVLALIFRYWGWSWESGKRRPSDKTPFVSIVIPSYNSPHVKEAVDSANALDYEKKEIIVVNDGSPISLSGVRMVNNRERKGKVHALNQATALARGSIIFYLDADSVVSPDSLRHMLPWFDEGVAAVVPRYRARNPKNLLTRLISLEHSFLSSVLKTHMHFGSLISFRGCGVAISKAALEKVGGWKETMTEDNELSGRFVSGGYRILYEPEALVQTREPDSWKSFHQQRLRWGKGAGLSFLSHYRLYMRNIQFFLYVFSYMILSFTVAAYLIYQLLYVPVVAVGASMVAVIIAASLHIVIITRNERSRQDLGVVLPFVLLFLPLTSYIYCRSILSAARDKKNNLPEVSFKNW